MTSEIVDIAGPGAKLVRYDGIERFDVLPLLVATDGAIAAFGHDRRRLRPNIVVGGVEGLAERDWPGAFLRIGKVLIGIQDLRQRCVMTSYDPDTLVQDKAITREIYRRFGGSLALDCFVLEAGEVAVGDEVQLTRDREPGRSRVLPWRTQRVPVRWDSRAWRTRVRARWSRTRWFVSVISRSLQISSAGRSSTSRRVITER